MFCYIHIPFCRQKCSYCKFALTPFVRDIQIRQYLAYLVREIGAFCSGIASGEKIESLYFGGGTPSVLTPNQIDSVIELFRPWFSDSIEITLEANPEDITQEWTDAVKTLGVNRVSLGVQTLQDASLEKIGRGPVSGIFAALDILERVGFQTINVDWILGLPYVLSGQVLEGVKKLLERYTCIKHTSVYFLEKGEYPKDWKELSVTDEQQRNEYGKVRAYILEKGWNHYEISNFGMQGHECKHNRAYWNHSPVYGFGLSAASFVPGGFGSGESQQTPSLNKQKGIRFENSHTFLGYYRGERIYEEELNQRAYLLEEGMFGLRTFSLEYKNILPYSSTGKRELMLEKFVKDGLLEEFYDENSIRKVRPTLEGIYIIDYLMEELL